MSRSSDANEETVLGVGVDVAVDVVADVAADEALGRSVCDSGVDVADVETGDLVGLATATGVLRDR